MRVFYAFSNRVKRRVPVNIPRATALRHPERSPAPALFCRGFCGCGTWSKDLSFPKKKLVHNFVNEPEESRPRFDLRCRRFFALSHARNGPWIRSQRDLRFLGRNRRRGWRRWRRLVRQRLAFHQQLEFRCIEHFAIE